MSSSTGEDETEDEKITKKIKAIANSRLMITVLGSLGDETYAGKSGSRNLLTNQDFMVHVTDGFVHGNVRLGRSTPIHFLC